MYSRRDYVIMHTFSSRFCVCLVEILIKFVWDLGNFRRPLTFMGARVIIRRQRLHKEEGFISIYKVLESIIGIILNKTTYLLSITEYLLRIIKDLPESSGFALYTITLILYTI